MRLTQRQIQIIVQSVRRHLGATARMWLFGSRLDDQKRGGDVDIYVEAPPHPLMQELRLKLELEASLDMPVDLTVREPGAQAPIARIAKTGGVVL
ncbi:nucleotidyltransferase family protein [Methylohalobius crimeensis]|uniref:nucleotidyltransferase family protein n=1 Tax=Methylohalobius crimeensis TaxID=244365 RepID=UPI00047A52BF|nr:nucleotidyltransferase domain-containing protein [Methylohalobius crimeensis]